MIRTLVEHRFLTSTVLALIVGTLGRAHYPWPADNALVGLVYMHTPTAYHALAYAYTLLWYSTPWFTSSFLLAGFFIFIHDPAGIIYHALPPYPAPAARARPFLILGEQHHAHTPVRAPQPTWLTIPERGLFTGVAVIGAIGTGKTSACLYPFADQLLGWAADDPDQRAAGLILEVKGDFCRHIQGILKRHGRGDDYIELSLDGKHCYNPMYGDIEAFAIAYSIATLINQLYGRSKEPFWQQAYTHLTRSVIAAAQLADGYLTLASLYEYCVSPEALEALLARARARQGARTLTVTRADFAGHQTRLMPMATWSLDAPDVVTTAYTQAVAAALDSEAIAFRIIDLPGSTDADTHDRIRAVDRWYREEWLRLEPRLRTSIVEGIAVFLGLFDDDPRVKRTFCPPQRAYQEPGSFPLTPLPPIADLLEQGKVIALNFPAGTNPGLARIIGGLLKQDFQRAMLARIPRLEADATRIGRNVLFLCDEYQHFATAGGMDPSGDDRFFALSRQARCMPIVATQSISSLRSALADDTTWRTLLQCFRTKIFLALSDDLTAQLAADLCGRSYQLHPEFTVAEANQDATVSLLTGKTAAPKATITATKHYARRLEYIFQPRTFTELSNARAVVLPYNGSDPLEPTFCYLKPHYLDTQTSYFDHLAAGAF